MGEIGNQIGNFGLGGLALWLMARLVWEMYQSKNGQSKNGKHQRSFVLKELCEERKAKADQDKADIRQKIESDRVHIIKLEKLALISGRELRRTRGILEKLSQRQSIISDAVIRIETRVNGGSCEKIDPEKIEPE